MRELIDDYFRKKVHNISSSELWELSSQLSELGKNLSELKVKIDVPRNSVIKYQVEENMIYSDLFTGILLNASTMKTGRRRQITWLITIGIHRPNATRYSEQDFKK